MSSLTPCRFYAQGTCRYGNSCRFYHEPRGQPGGFFGNRPLAPATFQAGGLHQGALNASKPNQNLDTLVEAVKKDMLEWQQSKMWPYSCYGPVNGKACMPGFEDLSPEEFRLAYMQYGNQVPPEIPMRFQQIQQLRINYQQPTLENRSIIERLATTTTPQSSTVFGQPATASGPFGAQPTSSIFGSSQPSQPQTASIFGGVGATTAATPVGGVGASIFGGPAAPANTTTSPFGVQAQGQSAFGQQIQTQNPSQFFPQQPSQTGSIFGQNQTQAQSQPQSQSIFGQPQSQGSIFGQQGQGQPPPFGGGNLFQQPQVAQAQTNLFSTPQAQQVPQQPQAASIFGAQQQQAPSVFGQQQSPQQQPASIFGGSVQQQQQQPAPGMFGVGVVGGQSQGQVGVANPQSQPQQSIFGGGQVQGSTAIAGQVPVAPGQRFIYSDDNDLTMEEMDAFKAPDFTIESLPVKLPPQSLCMP